MGDRIYVGSDTGVYALNATTGARVWHVLPQATFYGSPAVTGPIGRQVLVIGSNGGNLYGTNLATGATVWTRGPRHQRLLGLSGRLAGAFYVADLKGVFRSDAPPHL